MPSALPLGLSWNQDFILEPLSLDEKSFHAYVHIPFCTVRCGYCDFNTYAPKETTAEQSSFDFHLVKEIKNSAEFLTRSGLKLPKLRSVFFGGGTPSLFTPTQFRNILSALEDHFGIEDAAEITTEANPESTTREFLEGVTAAGVNRISMGVQSFDTKVLEVLDRAHTAEKVRELIPVAKDLGLETSIDLIYGAPFEDLDSWKGSVENALELRTGHISAYSLIVEPGTKLERLIRTGALPEVDEDLNAQKYEFASSAFEGAKLGWYEVSNWGKPSVHNRAYWSSQNWWGFGPGSHSHLFGHRFWNQKHPVKYSQALDSGLAVAGREELSDRQMLEERLMLGLRTADGVPRELFGSLGISTSLVAKQIGLGLLTLEGDRVLVTKAGRLLVDRLVVDFLSE